MNLIHNVVNKGMLDETKGHAYIALLLWKGVDVNHKNVVGTTPLMLAVQRGKKHFLDVLLQHGADPNDTDKKGNSAFYYAVVEQQNRSVYDKLKEHASPNFDNANKDGEYIFTGYLRMAYGSGDDTIGLLLQMLADVVKYLLENNADVQVVNVKEQKAVDYSNIKGFNEITELILVQQKKSSPL